MLASGIMFHTVYDGILDLLFPRNCLVCRQWHPSTAELVLCPQCLERIPVNAPPFCSHCSRQLPARTDDGLCTDCRTNPPAFDQAWVAARYEGLLVELIRQHKFGGKTALRRTFAHILLAFLRRYNITLAADMIVPVPLSSVRLRERGYNQSLFLAQTLARYSGIPVRTDILERPSSSLRQSGLGRKERFTNMRDAFRINPSVTIQKRTIILVDDLLTTGATASQAAQTLKEHGAAAVTLLALAAA